jgi:hypothetical protein
MPGRKTQLPSACRLRPRAGRRKPRTTAVRRSAQSVRGDFAARSLIFARTSFQSDDVAANRLCTLAGRAQAPNGSCASFSTRYTQATVVHSVFWPLFLASGPRTGSRLSILREYCCDRCETSFPFFMVRVEKILAGARPLRYSGTVLSGRHDLERAKSGSPDPRRKSLSSHT